MSQEKVDRYKEQKANRKKVMKKEKTMHAFRKSVVCVIAVGLVGWLGFSAYNVYLDNQPRLEAAVDYSSITDYVQGISGTVGN